MCVLITQTQRRYGEPFWAWDLSPQNKEMDFGTEMYVYLWSKKPLWKRGWVIKAAALVWP